MSPWPLHPLTSRARDFGREVAIDMAAAAVAFVIGATGGGFLIAAGYALLAQAVGSTLAAALIGAGLLFLAWLVYLVRQTQRIRHQKQMDDLRAAQQAASDPLPSLVFDLAFMAGRQILAKRRR